MALTRDQNGREVVYCWECDEVHRAPACDPEHFEQFFTELEEYDPVGGPNQGCAEFDPGPEEDDDGTS